MVVRRTRRDEFVKASVLTVILIGLLVVLLIPNNVSPPPTGDSTSCLGSAECFEGTVTKVVDGDTLYLGSTKIRLALVDTPEVGESGYEEASQFTESLCPVGSTVKVDQDDYQLYDNYGRMLGVVYCGGRNLNRELLEEGHAVILTQYCDDSEFENQGWARDYGC